MHEELTRPAIASRSWVFSHDVQLALLGALLLALLVLLGERTWYISPLRIILGLAYVLYVPGYFLTTAIFPGRESLDGIERHGLSVGLSLMAIPFLALVLNTLPQGLTLWGVLLSEYFLVGLAIIITIWQRTRLPSTSVYLPSVGWKARPVWQALSVFERRVYLALIGLASLVFCLGLWIYLAPPPAQFMTEFYILGKEARAEDYPRQARVGEELSATLGITNRERVARTYRIEIWAVDPWQEDRRKLVDSAGPITLNPGSSYEQQLTWAMPWAAEDQMIELYLFNDEDGEPYRRLKLWLDVFEL